MKKLTRSELMSMSLEELGFSYAALGGRPIIEHSSPDVEFFYVESLGIQLEPDLPEINIKNLGKFMALFGEYPLCEIGPDEDDDFYSDMPLTSFIPRENNRGQYYSDELQYYYYDKCVITDSRWPCIEHESCELCEGVK